MRDVIYLLFHLLTTLAKLIRPGGSRTVIAENLLLKQQLKNRKYRMLFPPGGGRRPGPKGPSAEVIPDTAGQALNAIVEMKRRNPGYGSPRIAQQINLAFGLELDKDVVHRVLGTNYKPDPNNRGPSWLTTIGHAKDRPNAFMGRD